jgi:hypothetical protein
MRCVKHLKVVPGPRDGDTNADWFRGLVDVGELPVDALLTSLQDRDGVIYLQFHTGYGAAAPTGPTRSRAFVLFDAPEDRPRV